MTAGLCVVTGGNRGIGREVVRRLAERGHPVVMACRDVARGEAALSGLPPAVEVWRLDVGDAGSVAAFARRVGEAHGEVEVLVNNAGVHYDVGQTAAAPDFEVVTEALAVNALGAWRLTAALVDLLTPGARVVMVSSGAGSFGETAGGGGVPAYSVSKACLNMITVKLAADLRPRGVLVNAVCPGWVATDMGGAGGRPVADGAASVLHAVDLAAGGPTGTFTRDGRPIPW